MKQVTWNDDQTFSIDLGDVTLEGARLVTVLGGQGPGQQTLHWTETARRSSAKRLSLTLAHPILTGLTLSVTFRAVRGGVIIERTLVNRAGFDLFVEKWSDLDGARLSVSKKSMVYSVENCRVSMLKLLWEGQDEYPDDRPKEFGTILNGVRYGEPVAGRVLHYGRSEDQPYPGRIVTDPSTGVSVVVGPTTGEVADVLADFDGTTVKGNRVDLVVNTRRFFRCRESLLLRDGREATGEVLFIGSTKTVDPGDAVEDYNRLVARTVHATRKPTERKKVFAGGRVWGSWNAGLYRDISHDLLMEQARIIAETRPDLGWIQIDDGYTVATKPGPFVLEGSGIDREKFPHGMKGFADEVKTLGLRPALWMGLIINPETELPEFARDWLLLGRDGQPFRLPEGNWFLDFSVPEAREYMEKVVRVVTQEWGYEGFKFDFWSDHFHANDVMYRNPDFTGAMLRDWFWSMLRKYVGPDGYLLTCCCVGNGNPFAGRWADAFRCGIDIGHGSEWKGQVSSAFWFGMLSRLGVDRFMFPNIDSVADYTKYIPENMQRIWTSFACISGAHMEYAGLLDKQHPELGPKTAEAFNWVPLGQLARAVDFPEPMQGNLAPMVWVNQRGKKTWVAVCNWNDRRPSKPFRLSASELGLDDLSGRTCTEFWSGQPVKLAGRSLAVPAVPKQDALVFCVE